MLTVLSLAICSWESLPPHLLRNTSSSHRMSDQGRVTCLPGLAPWQPMWVWEGNWDCLPQLALLFGRSPMAVFLAHPLWCPVLLRVWLRAREGHWDGLLRLASPLPLRLNLPLSLRVSVEGRIICLPGLAPWHPLGIWEGNWACLPEYALRFGFVRAREGNYVCLLRPASPLRRAREGNGVCLLQLALPLLLSPVL